MAKKYRNTFHVYVGEELVEPLFLSSYQTFHVTTFETIESIHTELFGVPPSSILFPSRWNVWLSDYMSTQFNEDSYYDYWDEDYAQIGLLTIRRKVSYE